MPFDPIRHYEIGDQVYPLIPVYAAYTVGTNRTVVSATSGYVIYLMGCYGVSANAATASIVSFKDGSGGTIYVTRALPGYGVPPADQSLPRADSLPLMKTTSGTGLYLDVSVNDAYLTVWYLLVKA